VFFGSFAIVRFRFAAAWAFLTFCFAALVCFAVVAAHLLLLLVSEDYPGRFARKPRQRDSGTMKRR
jgi:hypothetical protein